MTDWTKLMGKTLDFRQCAVSWDVNGQTPTLRCSQSGSENSLGNQRETTWFDTKKWRTKQNAGEPRAGREEVTFLDTGVSYSMYTHMVAVKGMSISHSSQRKLSKLGNGDHVAFLLKELQCWMFISLTRVPVARTGRVWLAHFSISGYFLCFKQNRHSVNKWTQHGCMQKPTGRSMESKDSFLILLPRPACSVSYDL